MRVFQRTGLAVVLVLLSFSGAFPESEQAPWRTEFDRLCGQTAVAPDLSSDELRTLVTDCDALLGVVQGVDDPKKKLFLFRIKKCRNLFQYVLDSRGNKPDPPS